MASSGADIGRIPVRLPGMVRDGPALSPRRDTDRYSEGGVGLRILRFSAVGVLNSLIDFGVFYLLSTRFGVNVLSANAIAYGIAVTNSFLCNKYWTFSSPFSGRRTTWEFGMFVAGNLLGLLVSTLTLMVSSLFLPPALGKVLAIGIGFPWNYWYTRHFVYAKRGDPYGRREEIRRPDLVRCGPDVQ